MTTPSDVCKEAMNIVSKDVREPNIKFNNIRFTLNLEEEYSLEDLKRNAEGIMDRAIKFIENGYSCKGLNFEFKNIREYEIDSINNIELLKSILEKKLQPFLNKLPDNEARDYVLELIIQTYKDYETNSFK